MEFVNKNPKIYIFAGKARAGKDTCAQFISNYYNSINKKVICLQYSSYLKEYAKKIINWDGNDETKPRQFLTDLGTDLIRNYIDKYMLINRMLEDLKIMSYFFDIIIISDARLPDELDIPRKKFSNVKVINVTRLNFDNKLTNKQKVSLVETGLDDYKNYNYTIINDNTLEDLKNKVIKMLEEMD